MSKVLLLSHYYHPDDVSAALQFTGLAEGLSQKGFEVEIWPSNRRCHPASLKATPDKSPSPKQATPGRPASPLATPDKSPLPTALPDKSASLKATPDKSQSFSTKPEFINGVLIRRVWRPGFSQHRFFGRIINAIWLEKRWAWRALFSKAPDLVIIGTDPIFAVLLVPFLKLRWPQTKIAHWCFDLYPEYAIAEGIISEQSPIARVLRFFLKCAYRKTDLMVDLGSCMRERLKIYPMNRLATLTPWSLEEPEKALASDKEERKALFGESELGLLYSGNLSHPHEFYLTLKLARRMRGKAVFTYSARGSRMDALKKAWNPEDTNVRFAEFAPLDKLEARLSAPDVHLVSLKSAYTGVAVPSKFFGALAAGRPVLFEGDDHSTIAQWITEYKVGWVLHGENLGEVAEALEAFAKSDKAKAKMFKHCHEVYQLHFSKKTVVDGWEKELSSLLS